MTNSKNIFQVITFIIYFVFTAISTIILLNLCYQWFGVVENKYNYYLAIIILVTSIATGSFFLIRIYIENQLGIKEKEMIKEYQDFVNNKIQEQTERQNLKFDNLANNQNNIIKAFENISKDIQELKNKVDSKKQ